MTKIVRFTDITYANGDRCFGEADFGRHSLAAVTPYVCGIGIYQWEIAEFICGPKIQPICLDGWVLKDDEVEDVTQDEIDVAVAYCSLMGMYVGEIE